MEIMRSNTRVMIAVCAVIIVVAGIGSGQAWGYSVLLLLGIGSVGGVSCLRRQRRNTAIMLLILLNIVGNGTAVFAQDGSVTITKAGSTGDGTIIFGDYRCEPGCQELTIPYTEHTGAVSKAIPDEHSRFTYWKTSENTLLEGEWHGESGETVVAVFQNKQELFADDLRFLGEPPEVISQKGLMRGRYVRLFPEVVLNEKKIILNLFDNTTFVAVRDKFQEGNDSYIWYGHFQDNELNLITIEIIEDDNLYFFGSFSIDGKRYVVEPQKGNNIREGGDIHFLFEINTAYH